MSETPDSASQPESDNQAATTPDAAVPSTRAAPKWPIFLVVALISAGAGYWFQQTSQPTTKVPVIDFSQVTPDVVELLTQAREKVVEEPNIGSNWGNLGILLYAHNLEKESLECFVEAERLEPNVYQWPYLQGISLNGVDIVGAAECFERAIQLQPNELGMRLTVGDFYLGFLKLEESETHWSYVLQRDPTQPRALFGQARIAFHRGDMKTARDFAQRAVESDRKTRKVHELLSQIHFRLGNKTEAEREMKIVANLPDDLPVDQLLADVLSMRRDPLFAVVLAKKDNRAGNFQSAIGRLEPLMDRNREDMGFYYELAIAHASVNNLQRAVQVLQTGIERCPQSSELRRSLAKIYISLGNFRQAVAELKAGLEIKPDSALLYHDLGFALAKLKKYDEAQAAWEQAINIRPDSALSYFLLGKLHSQLGRKKEAIDCLRQAVDVSPTFTEARTLLKKIEQSN